MYSPQNSYVDGHEGIVQWIAFGLVDVWQETQRKK